MRKKRRKGIAEVSPPRFPASTLLAGTAHKRAGASSNGCVAPAAGAATDRSLTAYATNPMRATTARHELCSCRAINLLSPNMHVRHVSPILNVSDLADSFAWFEKLGWTKNWEWCPPGGPPSFG